MTIIDLGNWEIQKRLAMAERPGNVDPDLPHNHQIEGTKKVYFSPESERIANMRFASNQGFREAHGIQQKNLVDLPKRSGNDADGSYFNFGSSKGNSRVLNTDIPFEFKLACNQLPTNPTALPRDNPAIEDPNLAADREMALYIAEALKQSSSELMTGSEFGASEIEDMIKDKFPAVSSNIVQLATNLILNDAENMKSRIAGMFPKFRVLMSARRPSHAKQITTNTIPAAPTVKSVPSNNNQSQQQQQPSQPMQQKNASVDFKNKSWVELRHMILQQPIS